MKWESACVFLYMSGSCQNWLPQPNSNLGYINKMPESLVETNFPTRHQQWSCLWLLWKIRKFTPTVRILKIALKKSDRVYSSIRKNAFSRFQVVSFKVQISGIIVYVVRADGFKVVFARFIFSENFFNFISLSRYRLVLCWTSEEVWLLE